LRNSPIIFFRLPFCLGFMKCNYFDFFYSIIFLSKTR
jgi:hypothetical protein